MGGDTVPVIVYLHNPDTNNRCTGYGMGGGHPPPPYMRSVTNLAQARNEAYAVSKRREQSRPEFVVSLEGLTPAQIRCKLAELQRNAVDKEDAAIYTQWLQKYKKQAREEARTRKERRHAARRKTLPENLLCPVCKSVKIRSRQWVVINGKQPICKSCYMKGCGDEPERVNGKG